MSVTSMFVILGYGLLHCGVCLVWLVIRLIKHGFSKTAVAQPLSWFVVGLIPFAFGYAGLIEFGNGMSI